MLGFLQSRWLGSGSSWLFALVEQACLRSGLSHATFSLLVTQVHAQSDDFCVLLTGRNVHVFDELAHGAYLVRQRVSRRLYLVQLKLRHLLLSVNIAGLASSGHHGIVESLLASVVILVTLGWGSLPETMRSCLVDQVLTGPSAEQSW